MSDSLSLSDAKALSHLRGSQMPQKFVYLCPSQQAAWKAFVTLLTLKHSMATHLPEGGTDLPRMKELLGHKSLSTMLTYTYVSRKYISKIQAPLDKL